MSSEITIMVQPTPNPNALKFILGKIAKTEGHSTYRSPMECQENALAKEIFTIRGIDQLHFFDNTITNNKIWFMRIGKILKVSLCKPCKKAFLPMIQIITIQILKPKEEAHYQKIYQAIEDILDRTIRPGLQADGGDIMTISYESKILLVKYAGACGTCPSSTTGTLYAIKSILQDEYDPEIDVFIAPDY